MVISLEKVKYLNAYKLELTFSDGIVRTIDFEPFLKAANNPATNKYLELKYFKKFQLKYGDLIWEDY